MTNQRKFQIAVTCVSFTLVTACLFIKSYEAFQQHQEETETETEIRTITETEAETETEMKTETETKKLKDIVTLNNFKSVHNHPNTEHISPLEFKSRGKVYFNGWSFSYYSEKVLPGKRLNIPGRHSDGTFVRDAEENICVASSELKWGTYIETPWGLGRVYDSGCALGTIDIYVSW